MYQHVRKRDSHMLQHTVGFAEGDSVSTYTRVTLSILRWMPKLGTSFTEFLPSRLQAELHLL